MTNGSFTSLEGANVTAPGWITGSSTPDINDAFGPLNTTDGYLWTGTPISSSDGGTWQNLFSGESVQQTVNVSIGQCYTLFFEYAAQGITNSEIPYDGPVGVDVFIDGVLEYSTPDDSTQYTWESAYYTFIPTNSSITITFKPSKLQYIGIDGACLLPSTNNVKILGNDTIICFGDTLLIRVPALNGTFQWQDYSTNQTYTVIEPGTYWVHIISDCINSTDTIKVSLKYCDTVEIVMPNVFTPNNDGINDYFYPKSTIGVESAILLIYNRWGQKIFETNNLEFGWNGKYFNMDCANGTYFWVVRYFSKNDIENFETGIVTLIK